MQGDEDDLWRDFPKMRLFVTIYRSQGPSPRAPLERPATADKEECHYSFSRQFSGPKSICDESTCQPVQSPRCTLRRRTTYQARW